MHGNVKLRTCVKCGEDKPSLHFNKTSTYCAECRRTYMRNWYAKSTRDPLQKIKTLMNGAHKRARQKGVPCSLTAAWCERAAKQTHCSVTGIAFEYGERLRGTSVDPRTPSLDRIDPKKGYTPDNVRLVCHWVNVARGELTDAQFKRMIGYTADALYGSNHIQDEDFATPRVDAAPVPNPVPRRNGSRSKARPPRVVPKVGEGQYLH
jgi:hypothetical protein